MWSRDGMRSAGEDGVGRKRELFCAWSQSESEEGGRGDGGSFGLLVEAVRPAWMLDLVLEEVVPWSAVSRKTVLLDYLLL